eukprot:2514423-Pyramimonas_sp.AAC.1
MAIRRYARSRLFETSSRNRLREAASAPRHRDQKYAPGDWVYAWRRAHRTGKKHTASSATGGQDRAW